MANTLFFKVFYLLAVIALLAPIHAHTAARRDDAGHLGRTYGQLDGVTKRLTNAQRLSRGLPLNKPAPRRNGAIRARASATFSGSDSASATPSSLIPLPPTSSAVSSSAAPPSSSPASSVPIPPTSSSASSTPASSIASSSAPASSSAAPTPVCNPNVGAAQSSRRIAIDLGNTGTLSGYYVSANPGYGGIATITQSTLEAQNIMFTPCIDPSVTTSLLRVGASVFPYLGAARAGLPANLGGSSIAYITFVSRSPAYSPAVIQLSSWLTTSSTESAIWLYDLNTGKFGAQWVNSDGSIVHVQTILTGQNQLAIVEDFVAYHATDPQSQLAVLRLA